jgi:hypothetical protein
MRRMKFGIHLAALALLVVPCTHAYAADTDWINLFNGKDLEGWVQHGGKARYSVEQGAIVGTTVLRTGNSFLCTEVTYGDFVLELEFKVDPVLNSGVQVRSEVFPEARVIQAENKELKLPADRVHGYQVEIDMNPGNARFWTGGIYDEARRGWLFPGTLGGDKKRFTEQGAKVSKPTDWNSLKVEASGDSIKTWLNGELRASIKDSLTPHGLIALQVHGVGNDQKREGIQVRWRNIRLKPLKAS